MIDNSEHGKLVQLLLDNGFDSGWTLAGLELQQWEHEEDPPKPLTRPKA